MGFLYSGFYYKKVVPYIVAPISISPNQGDITGGTYVIITVANSAGLISASVGGNNLDNFVIIDATHVAGITKSHIADSVSVTVSTLYNTSAPFINGYKYTMLSAMLTNDFSTALAPVATLLSIPVTPGVYDVEYFGESRCSTVNGVVMNLDCPVGTTGEGSVESSTINTLVANWTIASMAPNVDTAALHVGASNAFRFDCFNLRIKVTLAGNVTLKVGSAVPGDTTEVLKKSYLRLSPTTEV